MPDVLVTRRMVDAAMAALDGTADPGGVLAEGFGEVEVYSGPTTAIPRAELLRRVPGVRGLLTVLTERVDAELLDAAGPSLRIVANHAVGVDNIDIPECTRRGVLVTNTPDVLTEATADLAWALILACVRRVAEGDRLLRAKTPWTWDPRMMLGHDLHGRVLGIVGCGRIGQATARRAIGFGMRVVYYNSRPLPADIAVSLGATYRTFDDLLTESDVVSVHCPLTAATRHLFDAAAFSRMKPSAVLVNTSRGPVVDELALAEALRTGELFAAGLDVFEREPEVTAELLELDSVTLLPHLGSATVGTREAMGLRAVHNLAAGLAGERPRDLLNPEVLD